VFSTRFGNGAKVMKHVALVALCQSSPSCDRSESAYRRWPLLRCAGLSRLKGILSPNSPLMYFPSSAASGGSSACGASKGVANLPTRRGKPKVVHS
jgi:hypothetical protein